MMYNWFECKICYEKVMEDGKNKKVTEPYLVDALSFTEAEARSIEELKPFITGEFTVSAIKRAKYAELFPSDDEKADTWFKVKVNFMILDTKTGVEKKQPTLILVQAESVEDAKEKTDENMKGTTGYKIESISETEIVDVFPFKTKE